MSLFFRRQHKQQFRFANITQRQGNKISQPHTENKQILPSASANVGRAQKLSKLSL